MADNVASVYPLKLFVSENTDVTPVPAKPKPAQSAQAEAAATAESSNFRLTIETAEHGGFVYTISDPITGKVLLKLPREVVQDLAKDPAYKGGNLLKTTI